MTSNAADAMGPQGWACWDSLSPAWSTAASTCRTSSHSPHSVRKPQGATRGARGTRPSSESLRDISASSGRQLKRGWVSELTLGGTEEPPSGALPESLTLGTLSRETLLSKVTKFRGGCAVITNQHSGLRAQPEILPFWQALSSCQRAGLQAPLWENLR